MVDAGLEDLVEAAERELDLERVFVFLKDGDVVLKNVFVVYVMLHFIFVGAGCLAQSV